MTSCLLLTTHTAATRMLRGGAERLAGLLLAGLLLAGASWAQVDPAQSKQVSTAAGQTAADIVLDHVPAGISFEQYLLALYRLNPQLRAAGALQALPAGTALMLPSAAQAGAIAPDQARAQLLSLRRATPAEPTAAAPTDPVASTPKDAASQTTATDGPSASPSPAPAASMPAASPAGASATGLPVDPLLIIFGGGALLVILLLAFRRPEQVPVAPTRPGEHKGAQASQTPTPARPPASQKTPTQAPERLRPSLPLSADPRRPEPDTPPVARAAAVPAPVSVSPAPPPAALLSEFGALPSLDLGGSAPTEPAPRAPGQPEADPAGAPAPRAAAPGTLDLSGISLDLDDQRRS